MRLLGAVSVSAFGLAGLLGLAAVAEGAAAAPPGRASGAAGQTNVTVITSDRLTYDYRRQVAVFDGNVTVLDAQMRLDADKVAVVFEGTNRIKSVQAAGHVTLRHGEWTGRCGRIVYAAETGKIVMTGNPVLERPATSTSADEITFFVINGELQSIDYAGGVRMRHTGNEGASDFIMMDRRKPAPR